MNNKFSKQTKTAVLKNANGFCQCNNTKTHHNGYCINTLKNGYVFRGKDDPNLCKVICNKCKAECSPNFWPSWGEMERRAKREKTGELK